MHQVSGGPVYVSDRPGKHDMDLLKRMVLPDGSVLLCAGPGRPTLDCLFADCMRDRKSLLKVCFCFLQLFSSSPASLSLTLPRASFCRQPCMTSSLPAGREGQVHIRLCSGGHVLICSWIAFVLVQANMKMAGCAA